MTRKILIVCLCTITALFCFSSAAVADLVLSEGGATGQWYNPERNGEGFYIEVIDMGGSNQIGIAMYSYDENGEALWVVGNVAISPSDTVVQIPVFRFDGPSWGADYDPDDLNQASFGDITVKFPTCDTALFQVNSSQAGGLPGGSYPLVRITKIEGISCIEPTPPPPAQGYTPGTWRGTGVCFNVGQDGLTLTEVGSTCDGNAAFDSRIDTGISDGGIGCSVTAECDGVWPIVDGKFACTGELGTLAIGTFSSATSASGLAIEPEAGANDYCTAVWSASPD
jgi:hypothetical protein